MKKEKKFLRIITITKKGDDSNYNKKHYSFRNNPNYKYHNNYYDNNKYRHSYKGNPEERIWENSLNNETNNKPEEKENYSNENENVDSSKRNNTSNYYYNKRFSYNNDYYNNNEEKLEVEEKPEEKPAPKTVTLKFKGNNLKDIFNKKKIIIRFRHKIWIIIINFND